MSQSQGDDETAADSTPSHSASQIDDSSGMSSSESTPSDTTKDSAEQGSAKNDSAESDPALDFMRNYFEENYDDFLRIARAHLGQPLRAKVEPEDLAQTTCRQVIRDIESGKVAWQGEKEMRGYMARVLKNKVVDKARYHRAECRDQRREQAIDGTVGLPKKEETPSGIFRRKECSSYLERSIADLGEPMTTLVRRYFLEQATYEELAEEQGKSVGSIRHTLKKGLELLQQRISRGIC